MSIIRNRLQAILYGEDVQPNTATQLAVKKALEQANEDVTIHITADATSGSLVISDPDVSFADVCAAIAADKTVKAVVDLTFTIEDIVHRGLLIHYATTCLKNDENEITSVTFANSTVWGISDSNPSFSGLVYTSDGVEVVNFDLAVADD